jgi:hypothetical protein
VETHRTASIRVTSTRVEFAISAADHRIVEVGLDVDVETSHALRHLLAAHVDPATGRRLRRHTRPLLDRALGGVGAVIERVEVLHGAPPRFVLAMVTPAGVIRRTDLDVLDAAEVIATGGIRVVAVGWPPRDWDAGLRELLR